MLCIINVWIKDSIVFVLYHKKQSALSESTAEHQTSHLLHSKLYSPSHFCYFSLWLLIASLCRIVFLCCLLAIFCSLSLKCFVFIFSLLNAPVGCYFHFCFISYCQHCTFIFLFEALCYNWNMINICHGMLLRLSSPVQTLTSMTFVGCIM